MTSPGNGRAAPAAPAPERTAAATERVVATLERVAELHADLASAYRELAVGAGDIQLAVSARQSDLDAVPSPTATPAPGPDLLTAEDLAERLRVSAKTIRGMEREGRLPRAMRPAGLLRWRRQTIEDWLDEEAAR